MLGLALTACILTGFSGCNQESPDGGTAPTKVEEGSHSDPQDADAQALKNRTRPPKSAIGMNHPEASVPPRPARPIDDTVEQAVTLLESDRTEESIQALQTILRTDTDNADAHYWLAHAHLIGGDATSSLQHLEQAVALAPDFVEAQRSIADHYVFQRDCSAAMAPLSKVVELRPDDANAAFNRGHCRYALRDLPGALEDAQRACALGHQEACRVAIRIERRLEFQRLAQQAATEKSGDSETENRESQPAATQEPSEP